MNNDFFFVRVSQGTIAEISVYVTTLSIRDNVNFRNLLKLVLHQRKSSSWIASMHRYQLIVYDTTTCFKSLHLTYLLMKITNDEQEKLLSSCIAQNSSFQKFCHFFVKQYSLVERVLVFPCFQLFIVL